MEHMDLMAGARELLIEAFGKQSAFWGLGKTLGEIFGVLYMSQEPRTLGEIAENLGVTKGNVSVAIRNLERLGMVRRFFKRGDRRVFFMAETDFWKITRMVLEQRQKPEFEQSFRLVEKSLDLAGKAPPSPEKSEIVGRLANLTEFYRALDGVVAALLRLEPAHLPALAVFLAGQAGVEKPDKG
ncbi:MAG: MarR family transcriptional regulator [Firmicutes bacterium]|nr:MarR family transcriptional regulator [Bacillota bacterium]